jgi:hypothetical protein
MISRTWRRIYKTLYTTCMAYRVRSPQIWSGEDRGEPKWAGNRVEGRCNADLKFLDHGVTKSQARWRLNIIMHFQTVVSDPK